MNPKFKSMTFFKKYDHFLKNELYLKKPKMKGLFMALPTKLQKGYRKPEVLPLPTAKTKPPKDLSGYSVFLYGKQKTGKTSLTAQFPNTLHFFFEPSGTDYELYAVEPQSWEQFVSVIDQLANEEHEFKTFVLDVVDLAYEMCLKHICGLQGLDYPPNNDFGKTWKAIKDEFRSQMQRLAFLGGLVCVSHAKEKKVESRKRDYDLITPTAPNGCTETLSKWADLTAYYEVADNGERVLHIAPSVEFEAGNRMETRFRDKKTGEPLAFVPMGKSSKEAFTNFMKAFNNELEVTLPSDSEEEDEAPTKPKVVKKFGKSK